MLILFLLLAIAIYMGLYFASDYIAGRLQTPAAWVDSLIRMAMRPEETIFMLLRGLILVIILYCIGDFLLSFARRRKKQAPEEMKLKTATLPDKAKR